MKLKKWNALFAAACVVALSGCPWDDVVVTPGPGGGDPDPDPGSAACIVAGCSAHLCVEDTGEGIVTTCEWQDEYACYQDLGECARQADGECGWTETTELLECIDDPSMLDDCRYLGCGDGQYCSYCWVGFQCIPDGAIC